MPPIIGIDYGSRRIGLAIGDTDSGIASPLATVQVKGCLADQIEAVLPYLREYAVSAFVVGLPLNMDDTEGPQAGVARRFGRELARRTGKAVHYFDERLSSISADELLKPAGMSRKKKKARHDRVAAQIILQGFLDARLDRS